MIIIRIYNIIYLLPYSPMTDTSSITSAHVFGDDHSAKPLGDQRVLTTQPLASNQLLRGRKTVSIAHNGMLYTLQATKLGKLILTK